MNKYDIIFESIQEQVLSGEITIEEAEMINDIAYEKYVIENTDDNEDWDDLTEESVKSKIGQFTRELPEKLSMVKKWGVKQNDPHVLEKNDISDKDYEKIVSLVGQMKEDKTYSVYKKHFDELSRILGIKPSVIISYKWKKGDKNKNYIHFRYEEKNKRVVIPNGYGLYHMSPKSDLKELQPQFRGKLPRCYFYSTPRSYVTINKNMSKGYAQFKGKQSKVSTTKYQVCENIKSAFLDDRIGNVISGAVYIETRFPIKVKKVTEDTAKTESVDDYVSEGFFSKKKETEGDKIKKAIDKLKADKAAGKISPQEFTTKVGELQKRLMEYTNKTIDGKLNAMNAR